MSVVAIVMLIASAGMHAGWNLVTKSRHPTGSFFLVTNLTGAACLSPFVVLTFGALRHEAPVQVWLLLAATGFFMSLYYLALAAAYRSGQMSIAYPLARALPVILVAAMTFLLGRGHQVTTQYLVGAGIIVAGCLLLPMKRFRDMTPRMYLSPTCILALTAAVGTAGYSMIDDQALHLLRKTTGDTAGVLQITLAYACLEGLSSALWLALIIGWRKTSREDFRTLVRADLPLVLGAGFMIYLTYGIVLISLAFVNNVSYVVAFRQLSIPLGAALGISILHEPAHTPKLVGVGLMFLGLILVATG